MTAAEDSVLVNVAFDVRADVRIDMVALLRAFPREYVNLDMSAYEPWERPIVLLGEVLANGRVELSVGDRSWCDERLGFGEFDLDNVRWREADYDRLRAVYPPADPSAAPATESVVGPLDVPLPVAFGGA